MEQRNSQCEHRQPMVQTRVLFCMCNSAVAHCQSQHYSHFLGTNLMFIDFSPKITCVCNFRNSLFKKMAVFNF